MARDPDVAELVDLLTDGDVLATLATLLEQTRVVCLAPSEAGAACTRCLLCGLVEQRGTAAALVARQVLAAHLRVVARELDAAFTTGARLLAESSSRDPEVRTLAMIERLGAFKRAGAWGRAVRLAARRATGAG